MGKKRVSVDVDINTHGGNMPLCNIIIHSHHLNYIIIMGLKHVSHSSSYEGLCAGA